MPQLKKYVYFIATKNIAMSPFYLLNLQSTLSLIVFALIAAWYIAPRLKKMETNDALVVLALIHVFRYTPMTLLVPGQVSPDVPADVATTIAYGDLTSGLLALLAVLFLHYRWAGALVVAWLFNVVGIADIVMALVQGVGARLYEYELGFNWYILTYYVPVLVVTHIMMIKRLIKGKEE